MFTRMAVWLVLVFVHVTYVSQTQATNSNTSLRRGVNSYSAARQSVHLGNGQTAGRAELKRSISRGETQELQIDLVSGQYAEVVFEWQGIDLGVALFDPTGAKIIPADVQVSSPGPVAVSILADKTGVYKLEIHAQVKQKISGKYEIKIGEPRLPTTADRNRLLAQTSIAQGQTASKTPAKVDNYKQALTLLQEAADVNGAARAFLLLGDTYRAARDLLNAKASYDHAVELWKTSNYARGEAYAKLSLAQFYRSLVSPKDSLGAYQDADLLFAQIGDVRGQADASYGQAFARMLLGQTPQAINVLQQTVLNRRAVGDRIGEANALNMMADSYRKMGDIEKSLDLYNQASAAVNGLEDRLLEVALINGRALANDDQGYWQEASDQYARSLTILERLLGPTGFSACTNASAQDSRACRLAAGVLINLGEAHNSLGKSEKALEEFSKSSVIAEALGTPMERGAAKFHLGYAQFLLGNTAKALEYYDEAIKIQDEAKDEPGSALTHTYRGMVFTASNDHKTALELYEKAWQLQQPLGDKRALAIVLDKLATGYGWVGNSNAASLKFSQALELWREIKDPDGEALTLYNMASVERRTDRLSAANEHAEASLKLVESLRTRLTSEKLRVSYLANKQDYYQLDVDVKMALANSLRDKAYVAAALEANEKARARTLLDALSEAKVGRSSQSRDPELRKLLDQQLSVLQRLAARTQARTKFLSGPHTPEQISAVDNEITAVTAQFDELETRIRTSRPRFANLTMPQPATASEIQKQLDPDTLLLEYALGDERSYVWVISPDSIDSFELAARDRIEQVARRVAEALTARNREVANETFLQRNLRISKAEKDYSEASSALSQLILAPVGSLLGQKRLVLVADGALQLIPFASLPAPSSSSEAQNSTTLLGEHEIVTLPSASVLALQRRELGNRKSAQLAVAVLADPVFDRQDARVAKATESGARQHRNIAAVPAQTAPADLKAVSQTPSTSSYKSSALTTALRDVGFDPDGTMPRLALSRQEAKAILQAASPAESLSALDFRASREMATSPELSKYRIIHFATHGVLDLDHPELSGIVLSMVDEKGQPQDGYLRLHEIYDLNLPAELVVLSACQTGVGKQVKGEGLIALTRGFMYAGAKSVVASLWKVDDAATSELMAEFYRQMFANKLKPAAALRAAQLKLSQQKRYQPPYFWAGFFLQGEWN